MSTSLLEGEDQDEDKICKNSWQLASAVAELKTMTHSISVKKNSVRSDHIMAANLSATRSAVTSFGLLRHREKEPLALI